MLKPGFQHTVISRWKRFNKDLTYFVHCSFSIYQHCSNTVNNGNALDVIIFHITTFDYLSPEYPHSTRKWWLVIFIINKEFTSNLNYSTYLIQMKYLWYILISLHKTLWNVFNVQSVELHLTLYNIKLGHCLIRKMSHIRLYKNLVNYIFICTKGICFSLSYTYNKLN